VSKQPYRAPIPVPPDPYLAAWADLKRRHLSPFVLVLCVGAVVMFFSHGSPKWPAILAVCLAGIPFASLRFRCPHCGERMLRVWGLRNDDWVRCRNCGIAVGTPKALAEPLPSRVAPMLRVEDDAAAVAGEDVEQDAGEPSSHRHGI
jgi:hypothetical protein